MLLPGAPLLNKIVHEFLGEIYVHVVFCLGRYIQARYIQIATKYLYCLPLLHPDP